MDDTKLLNWLEENLMTLCHGRTTHSVDMGGNNVIGRFLLPSKKQSFRIITGKSIREVIQVAMKTQSSKYNF